MGKVKRNSDAFESTALSASFWPMAKAATAAKTTTQKHEEAASPVETEKKSRSKTVTMRNVFYKMVRREADRTKFDRNRLEYYLPLELVPYFKSVTAVGGRMDYDEKAQKLLEFVEKKIFGAMPDVDANATIDQVNGFNINGRTIDLNMSPQTVARQMAHITKGIDQGTFLRAAEAKLKDEFSSADIRYALHGSGSKWVSRKLVASLMIIAAEMK